MRQLNNNHFDTNLGATSHVSSASQPLSVTTIIKDEIMKAFKKPLLKELDYLESVWEGDLESYFATKHGRIQYLMEDMDYKDTVGYEFRYQLQNYAAELGIYKAHTKQEVDSIQVYGGKKRKAYCFKRKDKYYVFESWKPINDIVEKETEALKIERGK